MKRFINIICEEGIVSSFISEVLFSGQLTAQQQKTLNEKLDIIGGGVAIAAAFIGIIGMSWFIQICRGIV